jgi:dihydroorotase
MVIDEGMPADLTLFDPNAEWSLTEDKILSKSKNSASLGVSLRGKALGIVHKKKMKVQLD